MFVEVFGLGIGLGLLALGGLVLLCVVLVSMWLLDNQD
jgi:hypothetical protein